MKRFIKSYGHLPFISMLCWFTMLCQAAEPIVIGETIGIDSKTFGVDLSLNIRLPDSYQSLKAKKYPVLFSLGADDNYAAIAGTVHWLSHNQEKPMPEVIFVSLTTETALHFIQRGNNAEDFLAFFANDVIPTIDKRYRTQPYRIITASENFGMVPLYLLSQQADLFQAYIAISPWIENSQKFVAQFEGFLKQTKPLSAFLWLSSGDGNNEVEGYKALVSLLQQYAPKGLAWHSALYKQRSAMTVPLVSLPNALESLFADLSLANDSDIMATNAEAIKQYYQQLSKHKYGYALSAESAINDYANGLLQNGEFDTAIKAFTLNMHDYPNSPHVYANLADALVSANDFEAALPLLKKAHELAEIQHNAYANYYFQQVKALEKQLSVGSGVK